MLRALSVFVVVFLFLQMAVYTFVDIEKSRIVQQQRFDVLQKLHTISAKLHGTLNANLVVLRGIKAQIIENPALGQKELSTLINPLLTDDLQIRHVALAPQLVVQQIYPMKGNESMVGYDYRTNAQQFSDIQKAIDLNQTVLSGPLNLVQDNKTALIARVPVFDTQQSNTLWGIISAVIDYRQLIVRAGLESQHPDLMFNFTKPTQRNQSIASESLEEVELDVAVEVELAGETWNLSAKPLAGWDLAFSQYSTIWFVGTFISLVLALASAIFVRVFRLRQIAVTSARYQANYDTLTGLANRNSFNQQLKFMLADAQRNELELALFFIDLDHFKEINDSLGHVIGDKVLKVASRLLQEGMRTTDFLARLGGDEFILVAKDNLSADKIERIADKLNRRLTHHFMIDGHNLSISASIGIAIYPNDGVDEITLLKHADLALYEAKKQGRNTHFFFNTELREEVDLHVELNQQIQKSLRDGDFEIYYQPIVEQHEASIEKCEALIRWHHPDGKFVSPDVFIPVAEKTGVIRELGDWVLTQVCADYNKFVASGFDLSISINRSSYEFNRLGADEKWLQIIDDHKVPKDRIIFEITESLLMENKEKQTAVINKLKQHGITFAIDDFGTGYSALNYLRQYPVDYLKIDKSFIQNLARDEQEQTLVEVLIKMTETLGMKCIAEGVEEYEQAFLLSKMGCSFIQGYFYSKPMQIDEFMAFTRTFNDEFQEKKLPIHAYPNFQI